MFYIVQENCFREENYDYLIQSLDRMGLDYVIVKVLPFIEQLVLEDDIEKEFLTDRKDVFPFGSLKMARISRKFGWDPGSLMTDNHDYQVYKNHYKENLLNWDSRVQAFAEPWGWEHEVYFIRPCKDTKVFTGGVYNKADWENFVQHALTNGHSTILDKDTEIQVATVKHVQKEFRFWVIGGKVITGSMYRLGGRPHISDIVDPGALEFANKMIDIWQLDPRGFILDVCLADDEWKIVECGCVNCAGFYKANMPKVLEALEDLFNPQRSPVWIDGPTTI